MASGRHERDLYLPVKEFLQQQGFTVRGEVKGCDLVAVRGDELVIVELKLAFNLPLLLQGVARLKLTEAVYLVVEAPRRGRRSRRWSEILTLCRRIGVGLMLVHFTGKSPTVEVLSDPGPYIPRQRPKLRGALLKEFQQRTGDHNTGGSTGRPLVTAYREASLKLATQLQRLGTASPRILKVESGVERAAEILQRNVYGWFERVERGIYQLTPQGEGALQQYATVVAEQVAASAQADDQIG